MIATSALVFAARVVAVVVTICIIISAILVVFVVVAAFGTLRVAVRPMSIYNGLVPRHRGKVVQP